MEIFTLVYVWLVGMGAPASQPTAPRLDPFQFERSVPFTPIQFVSCAPDEAKRSRPSHQQDLPNAEPRAPDLIHLWPLDKPTYINRQGKVVLEVKGDDGADFSEGLAAIAIDGKWGCIDTQGKLVIPLRFDWVGSFSEGRAAAELGDKWAYIDRSGKVVWSQSE